MIKNERQYRIAKANLEKWLKTLAQIKTVQQPETPDWVIAEQLKSIEEQVRQLQAELKEYDDTVSGVKKLPSPSVVGDVPSLLIAWRIARHMTQRQLAEKAGINENLLQKYEAENYGCAAFNTIAHIARILQDEEIGQTSQCAER
jgi:ribosome-binding protein aMBF1 (putative translation factor)